MSRAITSLLTLLDAGMPVVRMVIAQVEGSAPREPGADMLYWLDRGGQVQSAGSIGGGHLEHRAMAIANHLLVPGQSKALPIGIQTSAPARRHIERFTLGASLGQCCGGTVTLYWERFDTPAQAHALRQWLEAGQPDRLRVCALDGNPFESVFEAGDAGASMPEPPPAQGAALVQHQGTRLFIEHLRDDTTPLWLYGAGHVGSALVRVLADLPFRLTWVDSREAVLAQAVATVPAAQRAALACLADEPDAVCDQAPAHAWHLVMTHCHDQDLRLCEALVGSGRFGFLGMIGSRTKAARFRHRLRSRGLAPGNIDRLVSPIGVGGIRDKQPAAIAISIAAQLLQHRCRAGVSGGQTAGQVDAILDCTVS